MKKVMFFFSALMIAALFTACEQDSLISTDVMTEHSSEIESIPQVDVPFKSEMESTDIEVRCSFSTGETGYTKVASDPAGGPMGFYSGKYRFWGRNNIAIAANQVVDYYVQVYQHKTNGPWELKNTKFFDDKVTFVWTDTNMYRATNGYDRNLFVRTWVKGQGCSWVVLDEMSITL